MPPGEYSCSNSMSHKNKERKMTGNNAAKEPPVSKLNTMIIAKFGILPSYKLVVNDLTPGRTKFMWRITCPISSSGRAISILGPYGRNKKEAKHHAAEVVLKRFLDKKVKKRHKSARLIYQAGIICCEGRDMLEHICSKNNLGRPEYADVKTLSCSSRSTCFEIDCKLGNLCTRGKGKNRITARLHATARMMQVLMETTSIHDVLKSGPMTTISNNVTEIVCSSQPSISSTLSPNLSQVCEQPEPYDVPVSINQELESNPVTSDSQVESIENSEQGAIPLSIKHEIESDPEISDIQVESIENSEQGAIPLSIKHEIQSDPVISDIQVESIENSEQGGCDHEPICSTMLNNNQWHCANSQLQSITSLYVAKETLTRLQAISQIDRTLGNCEKQLYNKILEAVSYSGVPYYHQTVSVHCHDYQVFIHHGEHLRILQDGTLECCDQSIRVACLTKILLDLKECIITNSAK